MKTSIIAVLAAMLIVPGAMAKEKPPVFVTSLPIADKPTVTRDPALGYVLVRAQQLSGLVLMRVPTDEEKAAYQRMRSEAFAGELKKNQKVMARYQAALESYRTKGPTPDVPKRPTKPIELTDENFSFPDFGQIANASIGIQDRFKKGDKGQSVYLQSLTPGIYRYYGPVTFVKNYGLLGTTDTGAVTGACFCMGSVKFEVKAGQITDLGMLDADGSFMPFDASIEVDGRIKDWPREAAEFHAVGKLPNFYGIKISRIAPMTGIIAYQRDLIIDLKSAP